ncbi:MAG: hypothetical protein ACPIOQ_39915, partial [Promethearchaeia archaeon]
PIRRSPAQRKQRMLEPGVHEDGGAADHNRANSERFCVGQPRDEVETVSSPTTTQACWSYLQMGVLSVCRRRSCGK